MGALAFSGGKLSQLGKNFVRPIPGFFLTLVGLVGAAILFLVVKKFGNGVASDDHDIQVYFNSAGWIVNGGRLYREVPSEYPLFANIVFAAVRYLGYLLHHTGSRTFFGLWVMSSFFVYLYVVYRITKDIKPVAALTWLGPSAIYFALLRYDVYPSLATLMFLFSVRRADFVKGAIWLGTAGALKGYALFVLPAYCVFMIYQRGPAAAIKVGMLAVVPIILALLATLSFSGWEGMIAPFKFHAERALNGETTYAAINYLFGAPVISDGSGARWVARSLQVGSALAAAAMRPKSFSDLVNACLFSILGFMSFSAFYSPQYILWILPFACFSGSPAMLISTICFSWVTYLYFPISYDLQFTHPNLFKAVIVAVGVLRLFMMSLAIKGRYSRTT